MICNISFKRGNGSVAVTREYDLEDAWLQVELGQPEDKIKILDFIKPTKDIRNLDISYRNKAGSFTKTTISNPNFRS